MSSIGSTIAAATDRAKCEEAARAAASSTVAAVARAMGLPIASRRTLATSGCRPARPATPSAAEVTSSAAPPTGCARAAARASATACSAAVTATCAAASLAACSTTRIAG